MALMAPSQKRVTEINIVSDHCDRPDPNRVAVDFRQCRLLLQGHCPLHCLAVDLMHFKMSDITGYLSRVCARAVIS